MSNYYQFGEAPEYKLTAVTLQLCEIVVGRHLTEADIHLCDRCFDEWTQLSDWQIFDPHETLPPRCNHLEQADADR